MSWPKKKLGDLVTVGRGSSPRPIKDEKYFIGGDIPWVKIADATVSGKYIYKTKQFLNDYGASFSRKLKPGSLIFPASGTLGNPKFLGIEACIHDGWLYFTDFKSIDPDWLYYKLITIKDYYLGIAYGAAIQNINTAIVRNTEIELPTLKEQSLIANILTTYDELIETNQRRIQLLEEAARRLYREWFVHLRFPGYEEVSVVDGIPERWSKQTIQDISPLLYGKALKKTDRIDGEIPVYGSSGIVGCHNNKLVPAGAIIVGRKGNVGSIFYSSKACWPIDTVFYIAPENADFFLYLSLQHMSFISSDAAVPGLNRNYAHSMRMIVPNTEIRNQYERLVSSFFGQIEILNSQNIQLKQARDQLLPKLMSGQLDTNRIKTESLIAESGESLEG